MSRLARWWVLGRRDLEAPLVTVVKLNGVLQAPAGRAAPGAARRLLYQERVEKWLWRAFAKPLAPAACALVVNCPGGSPAQSELIHDMVRRLSKDSGVPVYAFAEDVAASGGYWLMCAADKLYACQTSLVGSIGVVSASFGAVDAAQRLGIERRVFTAGQEKVSLDPFLPVDPAQEARLRDLMGDLHSSFQQVVKAARGDRLAGADEKELFSGRVWTGRQAAQLGLVDGIGTLRSVMHEEFGDRARFLLCSDPIQPGFRDMLGLGAAARRSGEFSGSGMGRGLASLLPGRLAAAAGGVESLGVAGYEVTRGAVEAALDEMNDRALWARHKVG